MQKLTLYTIDYNSLLLFILNPLYGSPVTYRVNNCFLPGRQIQISRFTLQIMITIGKVSKTLKGNIRSDRENNFQWNRVSGSLSPKYQRSWGKSSKEKNGNSLAKVGYSPSPLAKVWKCLTQSMNFYFRNILK